MDIFQIVIIGIIGALLAIILKTYSPAFAILISLGTSILILIIILPKLEIAFSILQQITSNIHTTVPYISIIIKIIGVSYLSEFGAQVCADAGETSIASKIELAGKIVILTISAPIIYALLKDVITLIP